MSGDGDGDGDHTVSWRELLEETVTILTAAGIEQTGIESRWIVGEASGLEGADWLLELDRPATTRGVAQLDSMVARRCAGEPIQYVLGRWGFRTLDLACDHRALIPRPETEQVVEVALAELDRTLAHRPAGHRPVAVDLGTGTGAIALAITVERPRADVWAVEHSVDAVALARANLTGLGMAGSRVRLVQGSWFEPLPSELAGTVDLVVTNPPYIGADEDLAPSVADWEPVEALVPGTTGLEAYEAIAAGVLRWLAPGGVFVAEIGATQSQAVSALLVETGLMDVRVEPDFAGHDRTVVGRRRPA